MLKWKILSEVVQFGIGIIGGLILGSFLIRMIGGF